MDEQKSTICFTSEHLEIIRFCAIECELQMSGERSVSWMLNAWNYAQTQKRPYPNVGDVLNLGAIVEPSKNQNGFRQVGVRVGYDVKGDWRLVPGQIEQLCLEHAHVLSMPHAEWFRRYEEIHPFRDGNGRTGVILFNWLSGTLDAPTWPPNSKFGSGSV